MAGYLWGPAAVGESLPSGITGEKRSRRTRDDHTRKTLAYLHGTKTLQRICVGRKRCSESAQDENATANLHGTKTLQRICTGRKRYSESAWDENATANLCSLIRRGLLRHIASRESIIAFNSFCNDADNKCKRVLFLKEPLRCWATTNYITSPNKIGQAMKIALCCRNNKSATSHIIHCLALPRRDSNMA